MVSGGDAAAPQRENLHLPPSRCERGFDMLFGPSFEPVVLQGEILEQV